MAVSRQFSFSIDESIFPATLRVGHVRMYQRLEAPRRCSCDPPDHPTAVWLTNHWWAVGLPAPAQVQRLVQMDVMLDGALVVLGLLTLLAGPRRLREPISLIVGLAVCAAVAHTLLAPYYGGGQPVMTPEEAAAAATGTAAEPTGPLGGISAAGQAGQLAAPTLGSVQAADTLAGGGGMAAHPDGSGKSADSAASLLDEAMRFPRTGESWRQEEAAARRGWVEQLVEKGWLMFNVGEAALVGGLLLMMLTDLTLLLAFAFACCLLLLEVQLATGLLSAQPSLALPPLFLGAALCGGLFSYHFVMEP